MSNALPRPYRKLVSQLIATGRYETEGEVVRAGLRMLEDHEALRIADLHDGAGTATLRELIDEGDASDYSDWNPARDFAAVRAELETRMKNGGRRKAA
jgi:putative addiction module CopG family antidote